MRKLLFIAVATVLLAACAKEPGETPDKKLIKLHITVPNPASQPFANGTRFDSDVVVPDGSSLELWFEAWQGDNCVFSQKYTFLQGATSMNVDVSLPAGTYDLAFCAASNTAFQNNSTLKHVNYTTIMPIRTGADGNMYACALLNQNINDEYTLPTVVLSRITARIEYIVTNLADFVGNYNRMDFSYNNANNTEYNVITGGVIRYNVNRAGFTAYINQFGADVAANELIYGYTFAAKDGSTKLIPIHIYLISDISGYTMVGTGIFGSIPVRQNEISRVVSTFTHNN